jgi:hypothetical protein
MPSLIRNRWLRPKNLRRHQTLTLALRVTGLVTTAALPQSLCGDESQNGIAVGQPKVFDNRSLESMVEQFEQSLRATQFVSKKDLTGAIGTYQGSRISDISRSDAVCRQSSDPSGSALRSLQMLAVLILT